MNLIRSKQSIKSRRLITILLIVILAGLLCSCATMTHFPVDNADQSAFPGKLTPSEAVAFIQKEARPSSSDADRGSFVLDERGFSFAKTEKVEKEQTINGVKAIVEHEETQVHHVAWQSITRIDPYLKETFIGDLFGVRLLFLTNRLVFAQRMNFSTELNLYCDDYEELTYMVAALQTLMK